MVGGRERDGRFKIKGKFLLAIIKCGSALRLVVTFISPLLVFQTTCQLVKCDGVLWWRFCGVKDAGKDS